MIIFLTIIILAIVISAKWLCVLFGIGMYYNIMQIKSGWKSRKVDPIEFNKRVLVNGLATVVLLILIIERLL